MIKQVEFNSKSGNPFYGMSNTLQIYQNASKGMAPSGTSMEAAWKEAKTIEQKAVLLSVLFFVGDVTNRQHNIFEGKVDGGGSSQREVFRDSIIPFITRKVNHWIDKQVLMALVTEYTVMDNILAARVRTKKKTNKVETVINMIEVFGIEAVAHYASEIIQNGTVFQKMCLAKFLGRPRFSKRPGKKQMLPETLKVMQTKSELISQISKNLGLVIVDKGTYKDFQGYYAWRKEYIVGLESYLFSSKGIKTLDKEQFFELLEKAPSEARFRIRNRVLFGDKWGQLKEWYALWEKFKEDKQTEQRALETKIASGTATAKDAKDLAKVKKEAKVNTGAVDFAQLFQQIIMGTVDKIKVQPFLDRINLPYNSLVFVDDSGSMQSGRGNGFSAFDFAAFISTIMLMKNPDADARDLIGLFSRETRMFNGVSSLSTSPNSLMRKTTVNTAPQPLIDSEAHFLDNLQRMRRFLKAEETWNGTNIGSVPDYLNAWTQGDSNRIEELQKYPIWTFISDGNFNNHGGAASSLNDFMRKCQNYFGFKPYLILIDVAGQTSASITTFSGIDNVMMVPPNPANIEMLLTNFKDMDTYDVYTPLLSFSRSNRYAPVRDFAEKAL